MSKSSVFDRLGTSTPRESVFNRLSISLPTKEGTLRTRRSAFDRLGLRVAQLTPHDPRKEKVAYKREMAPKPTVLSLHI